MHDTDDRTEDQQTAPRTSVHGGRPSPAEELRKAVGTGRPVRRGRGEPAAQGNGWGEDRQLPAALLYELVTRSEGTEKPRAAVLVGLRITGRLNLEGAELQVQLIAHQCHFDEPVNLIAAKAPEIRLTACHLPGAALDQLETRGNLDLSQSTLPVIALPGAHIGGQLDLTGAVLTSGSYPPDLGDGTLRPSESPTDAIEGVALVADALQVDQDVFCGDGFAAEGEVRLRGAHIGGLLSFAGGRLGKGLVADGLQVDQDMGWGDGFAAEGDVSLAGAHVGGRFLFGGKLSQGLVADGLQVDQHMLSGGFAVEGRVGLAGAHVGGLLSLADGKLSQGLNAGGLQVDQDLICGEGFVAEGEVSFRAAHIGGWALFDGGKLGRGLNADRLQVDQDMFCREGFAAGGDVRLRGAHIAGQLLFDGARLGRGLNADGLQVDQDMFCREGFAAEGEVRLRGAHIAGQLSFDGAKLSRSLNADRLQVDGAMYCGEGFAAEGVVRLPGAHIARQLVFTGGTLGDGLVADELQVDQDMFCREGFAAEGEVRLSGAHIGGQLSFDGASLREGLTADGLQVDGVMYCREGFAAEGEVRLPAAHIAGQLSFDGAKLDKGLNADGLQVDRDVFCRGFAAEGEVRLRGAQIVGGLSFYGARLGEGLTADGLQVDGAMFLWFAERPAGVDLAAARVGRVFDSERTWPRLLRLRGCVYDDVQAVEDERRGAEGQGRQAAWRRWRPRPWGPPDVQRRLRWIALAEESQLDEPSLSSKGGGYAPQPYTQLMAFYRQQGRDGDARRVAYERERRRRGQLGLSGKAWNAFLRWTVGYGYKPLRALGALAALVLVGSLAFSSFHSDGDLKAVKDDHPPFVASIYTLDRLIPVVSFGLRDAFAPSGAAQWWAFAYTLLGWALSVAVIAGLNAAVRRD